MKLALRRCPAPAHGPFDVIVHRLSLLGVPHEGMRLALERFDHFRLGEVLPKGFHLGLFSDRPKLGHALLDLVLDDSHQASIARFHHAIGTDVERPPVTATKMETEDDRRAAVFARTTFARHVREAVGRSAETGALEDVNLGGVIGVFESDCVVHVFVITRDRLIVN